VVAKDPQRWELTLDGRTHRVEVAGSFTRTIRWFVDDEPVASRKSSEDKVSFGADPGNGHAVGLRFSTLGHGKRVTLYTDDETMPATARATLGTGGIDLDPEPGSPAALREERIRQHPWRHAAIATAGGVAKVAVPILLGILAVRFVIDLPWPDLDWPDLPWPEIPWPDIPWPAIPWPTIDLPSWQVPEWVQWVADKLKYVGPVVLAFVLARGEVNRRRKQDALKAELRLGDARRTRDDEKDEPAQGGER
jgi:hypothetical protein